MKDLLAWFGFKNYPFDKEIKTADVVDTPVLKETLARLEYMKRRGAFRTYALIGSGQTYDGFSRLPLSFLELYAFYYDVYENS